MDNYTKQFFNENSTKGTILSAETKNKYNRGFKQYTKTKYIDFPTATITIQKDTIIKNERLIKLTVNPQRKINKLEFITKTKLTLREFNTNGIPINNNKKYTTKDGTFLIYHLANKDKEVSLSFFVDKNDSLDITLNEISYDLLTNKKISIQPRTKEMMPMPFVTNDAIISSQKLEL